MVELSVKLRRYRRVQLTLILIILVIHVLVGYSAYYYALVHSCVRNKETVDISTSSKKESVDEESNTDNKKPLHGLSKHHDEPYMNVIVTEYGGTSHFKETTPHDEYNTHKKNNLVKNEVYPTKEGVDLWIPLVFKLLSLGATTITTAVYIYLPELRKSLHGKIVLSTVIHSAIPTVCGVIQDISITLYPYVNSVIFGFIIIRYTWECIMGFEVWFRFSRPLRRDRDSSQSSYLWRKFVILCMIIWVYPIVFCGFELITGCKKGHVYFPIVLFTNIVPLYVVLFVSTLLNVRLHLADSSAKEILRRHNAQPNSSLSVYIKLVLLTGLDFLVLIGLAVLVFCFNLTTFETSVVNIIAGITVQLRGVFLMAVLIFNKRVIQMAIEKWQK